MDRKAISFRATLTCWFLIENVVLLLNSRMLAT